MDEILGVSDDQEPDLSDLVMVVINVETRDGRQLAISYGVEAEDDRLSMIMDSGYGANFEEWTFTVRRTSP